MPEQVLDIDLEEESNLDIGLDEEKNLDIDLDAGMIEVSVCDVVDMNTTAVWNSNPQLIATSKPIYVYSDCYDDNPGIKIGDGTTYLIDLPFVEGNDERFLEHIRNMIVHVTAEERSFWNNKVTCYISPVDPERVIFTKAEEE